MVCKNGFTSLHVVTVWTNMSDVDISLLALVSCYVYT